MEPTGQRWSHGSSIGAFEENTADPQSRRYGYGHADRPHVSAPDPMPLFLSDPDGEPDPREFAMPAERGRSIATRILAVVLAASAAAILVAVFHSDFTRVLIANAKASIGSAIAEQSAAPPPSNQPVAQKAAQKDPARVANPITLAKADARDVSPPAAAPSREAIATAYQSALQSRPAIAPPPTAAVAAPTPAPEPAPAPVPVKKLDADTLAMLMSRAKSMIAVGDIASARLLLERAAEAQDAGAAFLLAQTYDPAVLGTRDIRTITPDPTMARDWYQKAARLGSAEAQARLAQLQN